MPSYLVLRKLTGSELGWFAEPRKRGKAKGRQRGINFNAAEIARIFPPEVLEKGDIPIVSRRISDGQTQRRRIRRQQKNWRLVGDKVSGKGLELVDEGDFFWAEIKTDGNTPYVMLWDVVTAAGDTALHSRIGSEFSSFLAGAMASWPFGDPAASYLGTMIGLIPSKEVSPPPPVAEPLRKPTDIGELPVKPLPIVTTVQKKRKRLQERLYRPQILVAYFPHFRSMI
jgi:hypothetical protein